MQIRAFIVLQLILILAFSVDTLESKVRFFSLENEKEYLENVAKPVQMALMARVISIVKGDTTSKIGYRPIKSLKGHPPTEDFYLEYDNRNRGENVSMQVPEGIRLRWQDQVFPNYNIGTTVYLIFQDQVRMNNYVREATRGTLVEGDDAFNRIDRIYEAARKIELMIKEVSPVKDNGEYILRCAVVNKCNTPIRLISPFNRKMAGSYSWRMIDHTGTVWGGKFIDSSVDGFNRDNMILTDLPSGGRIDGEISMFLAGANQKLEKFNLSLNISESLKSGVYNLYLLYYSYLDGTGTLVSNMAEIHIDKRK